MNPENISKTALLPSTTPIAWTRGLREDGTWDDRGTFGTSGGYIVFMGGNVMRVSSDQSSEAHQRILPGGNVMPVSDLASEGGRLRRPDGTPTANILEALPPGSRVVGSGPATLHGSTGFEGEGGE